MARIVIRVRLWMVFNWLLLIFNKRINYWINHGKNSTTPMVWYKQKYLNVQEISFSAKLQLVACCQLIDIRTRDVTFLTVSPPFEFIIICQQMTEQRWNKNKLSFYREIKMEMQCAQNKGNNLTVQCLSSAFVH